MDFKLIEAYAKWRGYILEKMRDVFVLTNNKTKDKHCFTANNLSDKVISRVCYDEVNNRRKMLDWLDVKEIM